MWVVEDAILSTESGLLYCIGSSTGLCIPYRTGLLSGSLPIGSHSLLLDSLVRSRPSLARSPRSYTFPTRLFVATSLEGFSPLETRYSCFQCIKTQVLHSATREAVFRVERARSRSRPGFRPGFLLSLLAHPRSLARGTFSLAQQLTRVRSVLNSGNHVRSFARQGIFFVPVSLSFSFVRVRSALRRRPTHLRCLPEFGSGARRRASRSGAASRRWRSISKMARHLEDGARLEAAALEVARSRSLCSAFSALYTGSVCARLASLSFVVPRFRSRASVVLIQILLSSFVVYSYILIALNP
jgi:hypothetical protein